MAKRNISAQIPEELFEKLEQMSQSTGLDLTTLVTEAIASYLGAKVDSVSDRLTALEKEVGQIKGKLPLLSS